jgi:predicted 2-oxoglutarate/Fe(II)-dependent dioxygenase YbiX
VVFPSHMLHTVSPIKSGQRFALAAWLHGPPFQ